MDNEHTPTETNSRGGRQSKLLQYDEFLIHMVPKLRLVMETASHKYDRAEDGSHNPYEANWHRISSQEHIKHALAHLLRWYQHSEEGYGHQGAADYLEDDLINAAIRCLMASYTEQMVSFPIDSEEASP